MNDILRTARVALGAAALTAFSLAPAAAQVDVFWVPPGTADYTVGSNWTGGFVPEAFHNERAIIDNGGTAFVATTALAPSAVILGLTAGNSGTLEIRSGGTLPVEFLTGNLGNGGVTVGAAGTGTLRVLPGGTLNADGPLVSGANPANSIVLGGTAAGTASVNVASASFGGTTQAFPNADFNSAGQINFQPTSNYNVQITAAGAPTLSSALSTVLNGTLHVTFSGVTPTLGSSWDLFEAGAVAGSFSEISVTSAIALGPGERYAVNRVPVAPNRARGVLTVEQFLQIDVNRDTGAVTLANAGSQSFGIQGYTIASPAGSLSVGGWSSLDEQNALGGDWRESNPSANRLSELKPSGVGTLAGAGSVALGAAFAPNPPEFGVEIDDLTFQYVKADGTTATGVVNYTGTRLPNNLVLQVDPATGAARLRNTSPFTVAIDGYTVSSETGSLSVAGWNSLDAQNAAGGDWRESNASPNRLSELKPTSFTTLASGTSFDLGNPFAVGGAEDLVFEFLFAGENVPFLGEVLYGAIAPGVPGDYNDNGIVDAADYTAWRDNLGGATLDNRGAGITGPVGQADYDFWKSRFGMIAGSGAAVGGLAAVPEPHSSGLLMAAAAGLWAGIRRRSTSRRGIAGM